MFVIIGATGRVGRATAAALREAGVPVKAIVHDVGKAELLREIGCGIVVADLQDSGALVKAIGEADAVQVVIPLRPQTVDPAADLRRSGESLIHALQAAKPKRSLVISDYGAHVSEDIGMPSIFHVFETMFRGLSGQKVILRSAEHMHNWARSIPKALESGVLPVFEEKIECPRPTIAAQDLGLISARLLLQDTNGSELEIFHAEGPCRYSATDVADALSKLSGSAVRAEAIPRSQWQAAMAGMPPSLASLLSKVGDAKSKDGLIDVEPNVGETIYGTTELIDALKPLMPKP